MPDSAASARGGERLAEHRSVLEQAPLLRCETVQARRDQSVQRLRHLERLDFPRRPVDGALLHEQAAIEQHPHRLDRVERHALGASEDLVAQPLRQARDEPVEQLLHRLLRERLHVERAEVAQRRAPRGATFVQLGPGERDHVERVVARPLEQVLDEVEQARVGPLHVLEREHGGVRVGEALEEEAPGREQVLTIERGRLLQAEQVREPRLDESALFRIEQVLVQRRGELRRGRRPAARPRRSGSAFAPCRRAPSRRRLRRRRDSGRGATRPCRRCRRSTCRTPTSGATSRCRRCRSP